MTPREKFFQLHGTLNAALIDREEEVSCMLLALAAGEHMLMVGPPGTGKSLLCEGLGEAIAGADVFSKLITKYSEPSELFGPVSLRGLKEDRYEHVIDGFLPTAHVTFVDEIGKSSPAIMNQLLTVMNERKFDNGPNRIDCPLRILVAASNEWPVGEGYETCQALFDRFLIRKTVSYVSPMSLDSLIWGALPEIGETLTLEEVDAAQDEVSAMPWSDDAKEALLTILDRLRREGIRPSDRRVRKSTQIAQAAAWFRGRDEVAVQDLECLQHVLWEDPIEHPQKTADIVIDIANPGAHKLAELLQTAAELTAGINPRSPDADTYADIAKLKEVSAKLKDLPGDRAEEAAKRVNEDANRLTMALMA